MSDPKTSTHKTFESNDLYPFMERLKEIFAAISEKYDQAASHYGFHCSGCDENCCETLFFHHTYLEFFYLKQGFERLHPDIRKRISGRAVEVCTEVTQNSGKAGQTVRIMCPVNIGGKCAIYDYRPMICRMHGIPSEWTFPGNTGKNKTVFGSGCELFSRQCARKKYFKFDRTPYYIRMSRLEQQLREHFGLNQKIRMTVAQILACSGVPGQPQNLEP